MEKIRVNLKKTVDKSYDIVIARNILHEIPNWLKQKTPTAKYAIITESNVKKKYGDVLLSEMNKEGLKCALISFNVGEKNKTRRTKEIIENKMLKMGLGRDTIIIALGGGVVGDIAGFVAANYYRGISYVQVPTTMLAMADSSVGGKTAVDTEFGKNLIGAFHQPKKVYIDAAMLDTLPEKEMKNGIAETIKHAVIKDKSFFRYLEKNMSGLLKKDEKVIEYAIKRNCEIKARIVELDEKEKGIRKILNCGHTVGHAMESASGYKLPHGKAIALGMVAAANISSKLGFMQIKDLIRVKNLIAAAGLLTRIPAGISTASIIKAMQYDKKIVDGKIMFVLPKSIGDVFFKDDVPLSVVREVIEGMK